VEKIRRDESKRREKSRKEMETIGDMRKKERRK